MASNQNISRSSGTTMTNGTLPGSILPGTRILISGLSIGGGIRKLNKTMNEKSFASVNNITQPDSMNYSEKKYLTEDEAAEYLNLSTQEIVNLITSGEISEYVKTSSGYSISVNVLDDWFDNESYQNKIAENTVSDGENSGEQ